MLNWSPEQKRVAFHLFGADTSSPCPDCGAVWATTMSGPLVKPTIRHRKGCAYSAAVRKSLTGKKGAAK